VKLQYRRASQDIFGLIAAPVLVFALMEALKTFVVPAKLGTQCMQIPEFTTSRIPAIAGTTKFVRFEMLS
jgi:hypothetical protein